MDYWPSARWKMLISGTGSEQWIEPATPFALIGSHPCCVGRIEESRVPPAVYLACCFADSVEVWPLCPIAYPRWGVTLPEHNLSVGKHRISLFHQSHRLWPEVAKKGVIPDTNSTTSGAVGVAQGVMRKISLDWDGKQRSKSLARRVMIMGGDHPSTLRLYGQGLESCDHAVICVGASVWLINLNPPPGETDPARLCKRLTSMSDPTHVGNIKVRLGRAIAEKPRKTPQYKLDASANGPSFPSSSTRSTETSSTPYSATGPSTPEALTSKLTDQLVRIDHRKFTRQRILVISAYTIGFAIAAAIVVWIVVELLLPMITEMTG